MFWTPAPCDVSSLLHTAPLTTSPRHWGARRSPRLFLPVRLPGQPPPHELLGQAISAWQACRPPTPNSHRNASATPGTAHACVPLGCQATALLQVLKFIKNRESWHFISLSNCKRGGKRVLFLDIVPSISILTPHWVRSNTPSRPGNEAVTHVCPMEDGGVVAVACPVVCDVGLIIPVPNKELLCTGPRETFQNLPTGACHLVGVVPMG